MVPIRLAGEMSLAKVSSSVPSSETGMSGSKEMVEAQSSSSKTI